MLNESEVSALRGAAGHPPTLIVLLGPTGVGKTEVSLRVAEALSIPVINADSRQIYKGIPIGTATPTPAQQARVRHEMVQCLPLHAYYNASMFEQDVLVLLREHFAHSHVALLSGGSMMYIDAVCYGMGQLPAVPAPVRSRLKERLEREGLSALCAELRVLDPAYYAIVDKQNPRRVVHALEVIQASGRTYTSLRTGLRKQRPFRIVRVGLTLPREVLYERINRRVDEMMELGLLAEAQAHYAQRGLQSLNTVGYKELFAYLDGELTLSEAVERIKGNTRRYARKQLTWFRRYPDIHWIDLSQHDESGAAQAVIDLSLI